MLCAICHLLGQFKFWKHCYTLLNILIAFGLVYCSTLITDLMCALFAPYAAMFVNRIYPGKSLKVSFVSPRKPWKWSLQVLESPGKQFFYFYFLYESWLTQFVVEKWPLNGCSVVCSSMQICFHICEIFVSMRVTQDMQFLFH